MKLIVDVISDVQCPWCWVGKRSLETAAKNLGVDLEMHWHPFQLNPTASTNSPPGSLLAHLAQLVGGMSVVDKFLANPDTIPMNQSVAQSKLPNIRFAMSKEQRLYNTYAAHTLLTYAAEHKGYAVQNSLKEVLLRMAHNECKNMDEIPVLLAASREAGLVATTASEDDLRAILNDTETKTRLDAELAKSRSAPQFNGVPYFTFPDGTRFSGGQPVTVFEKIIKTNIK